MFGLWSLGQKTAENTWRPEICWFTVHHRQSHLLSLKYHSCFSWNTDWAIWDQHVEYYKPYGHTAHSQFQVPCPDANKKKLIYCYLRLLILSAFPTRLAAVPDWGVNAHCGLQYWRSRATCTENAQSICNRTKYFYYTTCTAQIYLGSRMSSKFTPARSP